MLHVTTSCRSGPDPRAAASRSILRRARGPAFLVAFVLAATAAHAVITEYQVRGTVKLVVPPAEMLNAEERDVRALDMQVVCNGCPAIGRFRDTPPPAIADLPGTNEDCSTFTAGDDGYFNPYYAAVGQEGLGETFHLQTVLYYDLFAPPGVFGHDHYYFDSMDTAPLDLPSMTLCEPTVMCLDNQDQCECTALILVDFYHGDGCPNRDVIGPNEAGYPQDGSRITADRRGLPTNWSAHKADTDVYPGHATAFLVGAYPGATNYYDFIADLIVGTDRFVDRFRYVLKAELNDVRCGGVYHVRFDIPCEGVDVDCCHDNPGDPCCNGGTAGVCCEGGPTNPGPLSGNWQVIDYETQVIYSDEERLPTMRLDRGVDDNERLAQVQPSADAPPYACNHDLARFDFTRVRHSPDRATWPVGVDYPGNYRISSFHMLHDNVIDAEDGQPCGPYETPAKPCGHVEMVWSTSGAGARVADTTWSNGEMLWETCVDTDPADIYEPPDAQRDWLYLPSGQLPATLQRCADYPPDGATPPPPGCVDTLDPQLCLTDLRKPFVMRPGSMGGAVSLWDGDVPGTGLDVLEHLTLDSFALGKACFACPNRISGSLTFVHADGITGDEVGCLNAAAAPNPGFIRDGVPQVLPFWWNQHAEQGMVQSNFVLRNAVVPGSCLDPDGGGVRQFDYRLVPAEVGNVSGWYEPSLQLKFRKLNPNPAIWQDWFDGSVRLLPRVAGVRFQREIVPNVDTGKDFCDCLGQIDMYLEVENDTFDDNSNRRPFVRGVMGFVDPLPTPHWVDGVDPAFPDRSGADFGIFSPAYTGVICPANKSIGYVKLAVPPGDYRMIPNVWFDGLAGYTELGSRYSCTVACGQVCRMCEHVEPICSGATVVYPRPPGTYVPLDRNCEGLAHVEMKVFDCDGGPNAVVSVLACTADIDSRMDPADPTYAGLAAVCVANVPGCPYPMQEITPTIGDTPPCDIANVQMDLTVRGGSAPCPKTTHVCFVVREVPDVPGHVSTACEVDVESRDDTPPVITCPGPASFQCPGDVPPCSPNQATATDNCGVPDVACLADVVTGTCPRTITRSWSATDHCGNSATCSQVITVRDTVPPVITCPPNASFQCLGDVPACSPGQATATDNCPFPVTVTCLADVVTGTCPRTITRTWRATDWCGNTADCTQVITVRDTIPPVITCPGAALYQCLSNVPACDPVQATATDNCPGVAVTCLPDVVTGTCPKTVTRTYRATDWCGNTADCTQTITVSDTTPPVITCPGPASYQCPGDVPACDPTRATATDNCTDPVTITCDPDVTTGTCPRTITRTYRATDWCNNQATCTQTITVRDTIPPVITCPGPVSYQCLGDVPACSPGQATATDNCPLTVTVTCLQDVITGTCPKTITRTWRATDWCGNQAECSQTITVRDTIAPVVTCPGPANYQCLGDVPACDPAQASATDNCPGTLTITCDPDVVTGTCPKTITRTYRAVDACGNAGTCTQVITVRDTIPPVITCPPGASYQCPQDVPPCNPALPTVTDNCPGTIGVTCDPDVSVGTCPRTITRTYRATDGCGNQSTCTQVFTVRDTIPPVLMVSPVSYTIQSNSRHMDCWNLPPYSAVDNCDPLPLTYSVTCTCTCVGVGACPMPSPPDPDCTFDPVTRQWCVREEKCRGTDRIYRLTLRVTDWCGNFAEADLGTVTVLHDHHFHAGALKQPDTIIP